MNSIILFIVGACAGTLGSLLGLGGGVIIVPVLNLFLGVPMHTAIGTSLIGVIATSTGAVGFFLKKGLVDLRLGLTLELTTTLGAITGALVTGSLSPDLLRLIYGLFLLYIVWSMARRPDTAKIGPPQKAGGPSKGHARRGRWKNLHFGLLASFFAGILSGLLGVGGGTIKIPAMYLIMGLPLKVATATSTYMIGITALASSTVFEIRGYIDYQITAFVTLGVLTGSLLGSRLSSRISTKTLRLIFIIVLIIFSAQMVIKGAVVLK